MKGQALSNSAAETDFPLTYRIPFILGGISCFTFVLYTLATLVVMFFLGTPPETVPEIFDMLNANRIAGILRLDILTVFTVPLYYILFFSIYLVIKNRNREFTNLAMIIVFAGITLFLAAPSVFSYLHLSDKYAVAATIAEKNSLISAGKAILASDTWHGTPAILGGILLQSGALMISFLMLKSRSFSRWIAYTGIMIFGLDLLHIFIGFFDVTVSFYLMWIVGPLYFLWFPAVGAKMFRLARDTGSNKEA